MTGTPTRSIFCRGSPVAGAGEHGLIREALNGAFSTYPSYTGAPFASLPRMAFMYVTRSPPCVVRYNARTLKPAKGLPTLLLLISAPTWLIRSHLRPSSISGAVLLGAPGHGASGAGFLKESDA